MRIAELAGIEGMIELEVTVNEEIRPAPPTQAQRPRPPPPPAEPPPRRTPPPPPPGRIKKTHQKKKQQSKNFIEELEWRGMIHTIMPGAKEQLEKR